MKLYKYESYDQYKIIQTEANKRKLKRVWVNEKTIKQIKTYMPEAKSILCHGVRNAAELDYFQKEYPEGKIIGTEISDTATKFKNVVQWDFHNENKDWIDQFDIVYSNSWDHSFDPEKSLTTWKDQIKESGKIFIEHGYGPQENKSKSTDPLEIYHNEICDLLQKVGLKLDLTFQTTAQENHKTLARVYQIRK